MQLVPRGDSQEAAGRLEFLQPYLLCPRRIRFGVSPPTPSSVPAAVYVQVAALKGGVGGPEVPTSPVEVYRALHAVCHPADCPHSPIGYVKPPARAEPEPTPEQACAAAAQ